MQDQPKRDNVARALRHWAFACACPPIYLQTNDYKPHPDTEACHAVRLVVVERPFGAPPEKPG